MATMTTLKTVQIKVSDITDNNVVIDYTKWLYFIIKCMIRMKQFLHNIVKKTYNPFNVNDDAIVTFIIQ